MNFDYPFSQQGQTIADGATQSFERAKAGLLSLVSGGASTDFPANPQPWEIRNRTDLGGRYMWNPNPAPGGAWVRVGPLAIDYTQRAEVLFDGALSGNQTLYIACADFRRTARKLIVVSDTSTTSDGSNNWEIDLYNVTAGVSMFSSVPTTDGDEWAANVAKAYTPNQNTLIDELDVAELRITENGTATEPTRAQISLVTIVAA